MLTSFILLSFMMLCTDNSCLLGSSTFLPLTLNYI